MFLDPPYTPALKTILKPFSNHFSIQKRSQTNPKTLWNWSKMIQIAKQKVAFISSAGCSNPPAVDFAGSDYLFQGPSDLAMFPTIATALCPVVNLHFLKNNVQVVLSEEVLSDIFLGHLTYSSFQNKRYGT